MNHILIVVAGAHFLPSQFKEESAIFHFLNFLNVQRISQKISPKLTRRSG